MCMRYMRILIVEKVLWFWFSIGLNYPPSWNATLKSVRILTVFSISYLFPLVGTGTALTANHAYAQTGPRYLLLRVFSSDSLRVALFSHLLITRYERTMSNKETRDFCGAGS